VIVDVSLSSVLLFDVSVRDVHVFESRMVVVMSVGGGKVRPVLAAV